MRSDRIRLNILFYGRLPRWGIGNSRQIRLNALQASPYGTVRQTFSLQVNLRDNCNSEDDLNPRSQSNGRRCEINRQVLSDIKIEDVCANICIENGKAIE
jgi:hypothetical protein